MSLPPNAEVTCCAFPYQVEGTMPDGQAFYFRARYGNATFDVAPTMDEAVAGTGKVSLQAPCSPVDDDDSREVVMALYERAAEILRDACGICGGVNGEHDHSGDPQTT